MQAMGATVSGPSRGAGEQLLQRLQSAQKSLYNCTGHCAKILVTVEETGCH